MTSIRWVAIALVPFWAAALACGSSTTGVGVDAPIAPADVNPGGIQDTGPGVDVLAIDAVVIDAPANPIDAPSGPDAAPGAVCGGFVGTVCASGSYCTFSTFSCGSGDQSGTCAAIPQTCPTIPAMPVCGCDLHTYSSECAAAMAGTDLNGNEGCPPPAGTFSCGTTFCTHGTQYCQKTYGGLPNSPPSFTCQTIPAACSASPTCSCFSAQGAMCASSCTEPTTGDFVLSCFFP